MRGYPDRESGYMQWVTDLQLMATGAPSGQIIMTKCLDIAEMLIKKNISYGDSALSPARIFAQSDNVEQIKVRIDDKLSRIKNNQAYGDEGYLDAIKDLIGYLILLKIALDKKDN
jgi:hypothetical protein